MFIAALSLSYGALAATACAPAANQEVADSLPQPGDIEIVRPLTLAPRARVPEKEPGFLSAHVRPGELTVAHDGRLPAVATGDVLAGTQGGGYLVRVTRVREAAEGRVVVDTEPAALTELIADGEVHIRYDAEEHARRVAEHLALKRALGEAAEGDGEDAEDVGAAAQALQVAAGGSIPLLDLWHEELPASCGVKAAGQAELDVTATLKPAIDIELDIGPRGGIDPLPEVKRFRLVASGQLDVSADLYAEGTVTGSCTVDLLALAGGAASVPLPTLTFWAGPVPIVVTTNVVPAARADVELAFTAAELAAHAETSVGLEAGVDYQEKEWSTIWNPSCSATGDAALAAPGGVTAACTVSAGAELRARLYGVIGPNIGVEAYARAQAGTAPPYCTYEAWLDGGVHAYAEAEVGVSVGPLELTLAELPLVDLELAHFEGPHFSGTLHDGPECDSVD